MRKPEQAITSLLYLAQSLPTMRRQSDEAAALVEAAIIECAIAMSGGAKVFREQLDLVALLRYALADVARIAPESVLLLERAIGSLSDKGRDVQRMPHVVH